MLETRNFIHSTEFKDIYKSKEFAVENAKLEFTEAIAEMMEFRGITRKELGDKIGRTKKYMKKLMSGDIEITVNEFGGIMHALDFSFMIKLTVNEKRNEPISRNIE